MHFKPPFLLTEFHFKTSRSGGKGGQNVNKVASKVQIDFSVPGSELLTDAEKQVIMEKLEGRLSKDGVLQIIAQEDRTQLGNKEIALRKMYQLLNKCFVVRKKRKASKPTRSSVEKRLNAKKKNAETKQSRAKNWE